MTTDRSEVAAIEQPDQHREAYALMRYESGSGRREGTPSDQGGEG